MKNLTIIITTLTMILMTNCHWINRNYQNPKTNAMISQFNNDKDKPIAFDNFRIQLSHMRGIEVYSCHKTLNGIYLEYYMPASAYDNETKKHEDIVNNTKVIKGDQKLYEEICQWFAEYNIADWDGFNGQRLLKVRDGITMDFAATLDDELGTLITAHGNNKYPKNYSEFMEKLDALLNREDLVNELEEPIAIESFSLKIIAGRGDCELYTGEKTATGIRIEKSNVDKRTDKKKLVKTVNGDKHLYEKLCQIFSSCRVDQWDGFVGGNPPGVYDGWSIVFEAQFTNGQKVHATGSNNSPETYSYVRNAIQTALDK